MTAALFDDYVVVDWSAASRPTLGRDSIWVGTCRRGAPPLVENIATRVTAVDRLTRIARAALAVGRRVLMGFDFPFGYPAGVAGHVTGQRSALALWRWLADRVSDGPDNANNRFDVASSINRLYDGVGPFWGRPASWDVPAIPTRAAERQGADHPAERRLAEHHAPSAKTVWQLAYAGAVGSQVITGLPAVWRLRNDPDLVAETTIWPLETGLRSPRSAVCLAEIYPSLLPPDPDHSVKDAGQVSAVARWLAGEDDAGRLAGHFAGPATMTREDRVIVETEEAWILGLGTGAAQ